MFTMSSGDVLWFLDQALDEMVAIVVDLGDDAANTRPDIPHANSPFAILTHCLGVMEFWGGRMIAGRTVDRDRDAEFLARGPVRELAQRAVAARDQLEADVAAMDPSEPPPARPQPDVSDLPYGRTQAGVLMHIYEELSQHLGQMELTRDVLRQEARTT